MGLELSGGMDPDGSPVHLVVGDAGVPGVFHLSAVCSRETPAVSPGGLSGAPWAWGVRGTRAAGIAAASVIGALSPVLISGSSRSQEAP